MAYSTAHPTHPEINWRVVSDLLDYQPKTGDLTWRQYRGPKAPVGGLAGFIHPVSGQVLVTLLGHKIQASHIVWLFAYRAWPTERLYPRDGDKENLRAQNWIPHSQTLSANPVTVARRQAYQRKQAAKNTNPHRPEEMIDREIARHERMAAREEAAANTLRHPVTHRKQRATTRRPA